jgi:hypothetical protein
VATKEINVSFNPAVNRLSEEWQTFRNHISSYWERISQPKIRSPLNHPLRDYYHDWIFGVGIYSQNNPWHDFSSFARSLRSKLPGY